MQAASSASSVPQNSGWQDSGWKSAPDDLNGDSQGMSPEEKLEDEQDNPWRNHEDDQSKWLGLLLAAVGMGAIGYLISSV